MSIAIEVSVNFDDFVGLVKEELREDGRAFLAEVAQVGAEKAREKAPEGKKDDRRTKHLRDSIEHYSDDDSATWKCTARHSLIIEEGGGPSEIPGWKSVFFWEKKGRWWKKGNNWIHHPPTAPKPYMQPSLEYVMEHWEDYADRHYRG